MKISLVSPFAELAPAALSKPVTVKAARVKADQPQQLRSVTIYWRGRKIVLMQRPQRRLSALLCKMLRRSWQNLFGTLVRAIGVGAMAAALTAHAGVANSLPTNTLPTPVSQNPVQSGAATITQAGNQMTVTQTSDKAIIDWQSFSIGSSAGVNFLQNNANSVALNRVIGNDPSIIMGSLTANGKIFLINAAGILVGKTGKIDVAGFTASTLNISDADFLAGKMNFAADGGQTVGNVTNKGAITSVDGGSVYLIGANVKNDGIITSPDGEVLLAAGSSVQLVDTSLPGVTINVGGIDGKVTNLGQIIASAGTIGIGAALIDNSGIINASSVEKAGGRIFLRATKQLTTDASSKINADGITGGNVQLYSDQVANIDGDVSALGSAGNGGYVDTSGKTVLSVQYVPRVGPGGTWFIDPYDVEIVDDSILPSGTTTPTVGAPAITATGDSAKILASTISATLSSGTDVTISTGSAVSSVSTGTQAGDITVNAAISNTGASATLTLDAANNISINNFISSSAGMNLVLNAAGGNVTQTSGSIVVNSLSITAGGNVAQTFGSIVANSMSVTAGGNVTQISAGSIVANSLSVTAGTGIALTSVSNNVQSFDAQNNTSGNIVFTNNSPTTLSLVSVVNLNGNITISNMGSALSTTGTITAQNISLMNTQVASDVTLGGDLTATGGTVTITSSNNILQSGGAITSAGLSATASSGDIELMNNSNSVGSFAAQSDTGHINLFNTGNLVLGNISAAGGAVGITTTNGAITQSGAISAVSLNVMADSGITLNNSSNAVATFAANNTGSGDISFTNGVNLTLGAINTSGNLSIGAQGTLAVDNGGSISGKSISLTTTGPNNNINIFGAVTATGTGAGGINNNGAVTLNSAGAISRYNADGPSYGMISGGALSATANGPIDLSGYNNISGFTAHSVSGDITLNNYDALVVNNVTATSGSVTLTTAGNLTVDVLGINASNNILLTTMQTDGPPPSAGDITINGQLAGNAGVTLNSANGAITQNTSASAGITTAQLSVSAFNGITLNSSGNNVSAFNAVNNLNGSGDIALTNASTLLTLSGNIENYTAGGNATIINSGDITATAIFNGDTTNGTYVNGGVTFTSNTGNVTLGLVNATNLTVTAAGSISQESTQKGGLTITGTMTATANTGIKLDNGNGTCGTNHVANFSASNGGSGNITLVNNDFPIGEATTTNNLVSIHNAGGTISVDNTGGLATVGLIDASGSVQIATHSPLTIGAGGITTGGSLTLTAGDYSSTADVLTLNGAIRAAVGAPILGGNTVVLNAAIVSPQAPVFPGPTLPAYGSGYSYSTPAVFNPPVVVIPLSATNTVDQNISNTTNDENNNNTEVMLPITGDMTTTTQTKTGTDQTVGGGDGEFGGSDTKDDTTSTTTKSNKPLPVCT